MSYRHRGVGADGPTIVSTNAGTQAPTVANKTPPYTQQTLAIMGVAALPWIPVALGSYVGDRALNKSGRLWGAAAGLAVSFFTIRHLTKKLSGAIT